MSEIETLAIAWYKACQDERRFWTVRTAAADELEARMGRFPTYKEREASSYVRESTHRWYEAASKQDRLAKKLKQACSEAVNGNDIDWLMESEVENGTTN